MSLLIQLRHRIKAIETIKKITHAMRLISMSSRSRLKAKEFPLREYSHALQTLLDTIRSHSPTTYTRPPSISEANSHPLYIIISSQRGLCGNFNTSLFHYIEREVLQKKISTLTPVIAIGKKATTFVEHHPRLNLIRTYPELHAKKIEVISQDILTFLLQHDPRFTTVTIISNTLKTFFVQKPHQTVLIPLDLPPTNSADNSKKESDYQWEQSPEYLLEHLTHQMMLMRLYYTLFESLLAEHAARFISMDAATRNAQTLLEETRLHYNKLRQTKITKELTELVSSM